MREHFCKSLKNEKVYQNPPNGDPDLYQMLNNYIELYNTKRGNAEIGEVPPHQVYTTKKIAS
ncbi:IS3 family transposase [Maribacter antarcticus]|uniref:IS3 family transposase n=1 Tax=Maribacter antarcticus TaxID=505250 RepID=UPI00047E5722